MKSTEYKKYLLTCSHAMSTSWSRTTRCTDSMINTYTAVNHWQCFTTLQLTSGNSFTADNCFRMNNVNIFPINSFWLLLTCCNSITSISQDVSAAPVKIHTHTPQCTAGDFLPPVLLEIWLLVTVMESTICTWLCNTHPNFVTLDTEKCRKGEVICWVELSLLSTCQMHMLTSKYMKYT